MFWYKERDETETFVVYDQTEILGHANLTTFPLLYSTRPNAQSWLQFTIKLRVSTNEFNP